MYEVGQQVKAPQSMPVSYGIVTAVYDGGRYYEVLRQYGRKRWRCKYTREELEQAAERAARREQQRRERAKANKRQRY